MVVAVAAHLVAQGWQADDVRPEVGVYEQGGWHEEGRRDAVLAQPRGHAANVCWPILGVDINRECDGHHAPPACKLP